MQMTPDNWDRAKELFEAALELDSSRRASFLAENCRDESLRQQIEKLLTNYQEAGDFLDDPILNPSIPAPRTPAGNQSEEALRLRLQSAELLVTATSAEVEDPMVGRQFGAYKLLRRIGQGGMAAVFLASRADDEYRKLVAVKLVQPGLNSRDLLNRFRNERQTLAGLDHPNIVKLLDGGSTPEGLPFLVMDYVEGSPIDEYCDQHKLSIDDRLHLFGKVCDAVQYAHQKLVVHRDLKPSNILVVADGAPKLLDFGIAKVLNPEPSSQNLLVSQTDTRCMTPAYASPEQMRGRGVTPATDIYSLGVVLYELLTGHRPYRLTQHTPAEIERAICEQEPETERGHKPCGNRYVFRRQACYQNSRVGMRNAGRAAGQAASPVAGGPGQHCVESAEEGAAAAVWLGGGIFGGYRTSPAAPAGEGAAQYTHLPRLEIRPTAYDRG